MSKLINRLTSRGDTIVEVMIVVLVMATILASSYAIAVRSLNDTQRTQEHAYALKLAQGQIENLKAAIGANPGLLTRTDGFCLKPSGSAIQDFSTGTTSPTPLPTTDVYGNYTANCKVDPNGGSCNGLCYYYALKRMTPLASGYGNSFTATVRWDDTDGQKAQVQVTYKVYKND